MMSLGDPLVFVVHRAGEVTWEKGQLCIRCGKRLPIPYTGSWQVGQDVAVGDWYGATPYAISAPLEDNEIPCSKP